MRALKVLFVMALSMSSVCSKKFWTNYTIDGENVHEFQSPLKYKIIFSSLR